MHPSDTKNIFINQFVAVWKRLWSLKPSTTVHKKLLYHYRKLQKLLYKDDSFWQNITTLNNYKSSWYAKKQRTMTFRTWHKATTRYNPVAYVIFVHFRLLCFSNKCKLQKHWINLNKTLFLSNNFSYRDKTRGMKYFCHAYAFWFTFYHGLMRIYVSAT